MTIHAALESITLPTIRRAALANADSETLQDDVESVYEALHGAFNWSTTPEGAKFWASVAKGYANS